MNEPELTAFPAAELADRVRDGRSCAADVARAHLLRIADRDPQLGAFQEHDPDRVLAEAGGVDARPDRFALPLAGVPVAVADDIDVAGYPTRRGSHATPADPARRDDELVKRLRGAGALIIGKTRMPELGIWGFTDSAFGPTRNPLDEALDAGGSSGGNAAALAAGMAALAIGVDGGGALRVPAAYCGLIGLKPGNGVLPLPGGADQRWFGLAATGPLARTVTDAALLFGVLADRNVELEEAPRPRRIALSLRSPARLGHLHPDQRAAVYGAAARLRAGPDGAVVTLDEPPYPHLLGWQWLHRWQAGVAQDAERLAGERLEPRTSAVVDRGRWVLRLARPGPQAATAWRDRMVSWLDAAGHDLLICPAVAAPPIRAGELAGRGYRRTLLASATRMPFTQAWNLAGLPALVAPVLVCGKPVGVQLVGRPGAEEQLLAAAARMERRVVPAVGAATPRSYV